MNQNNFWVCVHCMTFNHAPYITDALNGFTMQETTFPFVCTIIDDASTDDEPEVIRKYLQKNFDLEDKSVVRNEETDDYMLCFAQHKTNKNCHFAVLWLKYNHFHMPDGKVRKLQYIAEWNDNAKYIALCEGDDYWIHPRKLQMQVDFLESHCDYYICSHAYIKYYEKEKMFAKHASPQNVCRRCSSRDVFVDYSLENYFKKWFTHPLTCLYRNGEYLSKIPRKEYPFFRDDIFFYYILKEGKGALLKDVMGVYRINDSGIWSTKDDSSKKGSSIYNAYNIYLVEKDKRALYKVGKLEAELLLRDLKLMNFHNCINRIGDIYRKLPLYYFLMFLSRTIFSVIGRWYKKIVS